MVHVKCIENNKQEKRLISIAQPTNSKLFDHKQTKVFGQPGSFTCFRFSFCLFQSCFISLFQVSLVVTWKCLEALSQNEHFVYVFHHRKNNYAQIWQSLDCMQIYMLHFESDDIENIQVIALLDRKIP